MAEVFGAAHVSFVTLVSSAGTCGLHGSSDWSVTFPFSSAGEGVSLLPVGVGTLTITPVMPTDLGTPP